MRFAEINPSPSVRRCDETVQPRAVHQTGVTRIPANGTADNGAPYIVR
jgi:hypothetical protein